MNDDLQRSLADLAQRPLAAASDGCSPRPVQTFGRQTDRRAGWSRRLWFAAAVSLGALSWLSPAAGKKGAAKPAPLASERQAAPPSAVIIPPDLDADTQAELRECQTSLVPGQAVAVDNTARPELVIGRRRVFDRVRGYVCIPAYSISPRPVTQAQYESVMGVRPHGKDFVGSRPVFVSFLQAAHYCNTVSLKERLSPCYEVRIDKRGRETVAWPNHQGCTGFRLPAAEEAAAYQRGTESEWTWVSSKLPLDQLEVRIDAPRGFYLARSSVAAPTPPPPGKRPSAAAKRPAG